MKGNLSRKVAFAGLFSAVAVVLSAVENMLPALPFAPPGAKAGFSNVVVMFLATEVGFPYAALTVMFKSVFALLTRGVTASAMSFVGGMLSMCAVWLAMRIKIFGCIGVGVIGAVTHNLGQLCVCTVITGGAAVYYAPALIIFGTVSGIITGITLYLTLPVMKKTVNGGLANE